MSLTRGGNEPVLIWAALRSDEDAFAAAKFRFSQYRSHLGGELDAIARQRAYAVEAAAVAERVALRETRGRKPDLAHHRRIVGLREAGMSIAKTAELAGCSIAHVKRVTALHRSRAAQPQKTS